MEGISKDSCIKAFDYMCNKTVLKDLELAWNDLISGNYDKNTNVAMQRVAGTIFSGLAALFTAYCAFKLGVAIFSALAVILSISTVLGAIAATVCSLAAVKFISTPDTSSVQPTPDIS